MTILQFLCAFIAIIISVAGFSIVLIVLGAIVLLPFLGLYLIAKAIEDVIR